MVKELPPAGLLHRRPHLPREVSAPAVLQHARDEVRHVYETLPGVRPRPVPITRRLGQAAARAIQGAEDRAEAGLWRLAMRAAWFWLGRCLRRR